MFSVNKFIANFIVFCYTDSKLERGRNRYQISNHTTEMFRCFSNTFSSLYVRIVKYIVSILMLSPRNMHMSLLF